MFKILVLGDIVGKKTADLISSRLWNLRSALGVGMVIANGENASSGNGLGRDEATALLMGGVDVITSGNHIWRKSDIYDFLDADSRVIRPANYPSSDPGMGYTFAEADGIRVLAINLLGNVYMEPVACPFDTLGRILRENEGKYDISVVDIHAEATSEKMALAYAFDGRVSAVLGTHTHVQTSDDRILPGGTAYMTDIGMCGPDGGILGVAKEEVIRKFTSKMPVRFREAEGNIILSGVVIAFEGGRPVKTERISIRP